jgi:hypothetical protein
VFLEILLMDRRQGWQFLPDGTSLRRAANGVVEEDGTHDKLMKFYESRHLSPIITFLRPR